MPTSNHSHWDAWKNEYDRAAVSSDRLRHILMATPTNATVPWTLTTEEEIVPTTLWGFKVGDGVKIRRDKFADWEPATVVRLSPARTVIVALLRATQVVEVRLPMNIKPYLLPTSPEAVEKFLES